MFKVETKTTDNKYFNELIKKVKDIRVKVGVPKASGEQDGVSLVEIATINEFGNPSRNIPERSFIRETVQEETKSLKKLAAKETKKIFNLESSTEKSIGVIGEFTKGKIVKKFTNNNWKANAPLTIALKGSSTPLIDTGRLRQSIQWEIVKNKEAS